MPVILIVDACKPSLVMSSEVFKDKIAGATILVASSGKQCLEILVTEKPDMCVVDFDLPDVDGVTLVHAMRKTYKGPILLTAYPDKIVQDAVSNDMFAFNDAGGWVAKPVKFDVLSEKIDKFLLEKHRLGRRFDTDLDTMIIGKGAGRGKRAPKATGRITNISLGGAMIELDEPMKMKGGEEMTVSFELPADGSAPVPRITAKPKSKSTVAKKVKTEEQRIKCTVAWIDKKCTKAGIMFARLTDPQRKAIEDLLRNTIS
jgi:CheY-like chemotaxis protein